MRLLRLAIPVALLSLVTACGGSTPTATPETTTPTSASPTTSEPTTSESPSADAGPAQVLTGTVASKADPFAFTITLTDSTGAEVTTLKAGSYQVKVTDWSTIHNFNLNGTGVKELTTVEEIKENLTWTVTFVPGTYTYICDPHPSNMKKTFTVT